MYPHHHTTRIEEQDEEDELRWPLDMGTRYDEGDGEQPRAFTYGSNGPREQSTAVLHESPSENAAAQNIEQASDSLGTKSEALMEAVQDLLLLDEEVQQREVRELSEYIEQLLTQLAIEFQNVREVLQDQSLPNQQDEQQVWKSSEDFDQMAGQLGIQLGAIRHATSNPTVLQGCQPEVRETLEAIDHLVDQLQGQLEAVQEVIIDASPQNLEHQPENDGIQELRAQVEAQMESQADSLLRVISKALPDCQKYQQDLVKHQRELKLQLDQLSEYELQSERTGGTGQSPFNADDLEQRLSDQLETVIKAQKNTQGIIQWVQYVQDDSARRSRAGRTLSAVPVERAQQLGIVAGAYQDLQEDRQQQLTEIQDMFQSRRDKDSRARNVSPGEGPFDNADASRLRDSMSTVNFPHPDRRRTNHQSRHELDSCLDLSGRLQEINIHDGEGGEDVSYEELPIRRWGRDWDVSR